jgi:hypothetical protein
MCRVCCYWCGFNDFAHLHTLSSLSNVPCLGRLCIISICLEDQLWRGYLVTTSEPDALFVDYEYGEQSPCLPCDASNRVARRVVVHRNKLDSVILITFYCKTYYRLYIGSRYSDCLRAVRLRGRSSSPGGIKNFLLSMSSWLTRVHPTSYPMCTEVLSPGVKRPVPEADHSSPASAGVKKMWIYTSTPPYAFTA